MPRIRSIWYLNQGQGFKIHRSQFTHMEVFKYPNECSFRIPNLVDPYKDLEEDENK